MLVDNAQIGAEVFIQNIPIESAPQMHISKHWGNTGTNVDAQAMLIDSAQLMQMSVFKTY